MKATNNKNKRKTNKRTMLVRLVTAVLLLVMIAGSAMPAYARTGLLSSARMNEMINGADIFGAQAAEYQHEQESENQMSDDANSANTQDDAEAAAKAAADAEAAAKAAADAEAAAKAAAEADAAAKAAADADAAAKAAAEAAAKAEADAQAAAEAAKAEAQAQADAAAEAAEAKAAEKLAALELSGDWAEDIAKVAATQIGAAGEFKNADSRWDAKFVIWAAKKAEAKLLDRIETEHIAKNIAADNEEDEASITAEKLFVYLYKNAQERFLNPKTNLPQPGDIIFIKDAALVPAAEDKSAGSEDGIISPANRAGIVEKVEFDEENHKYSIFTIEGDVPAENENEVQTYSTAAQKIYEAGDNAIIFYYAIPSIWDEETGLSGAVTDEEQTASHHETGTNENKEDENADNENETTHEPASQHNPTSLHHESIDPHLGANENNEKAGDYESEKADRETAANHETSSLHHSIDPHLGNKGSDDEKETAAHETETTKKENTDKETSEKETEAEDKKPEPETTVNETKAEEVSTTQAETTEVQTEEDKTEKETTFAEEGDKTDDKKNEKETEEVKTEEETTKEEETAKAEDAEKADKKAAGKAARKALKKEDLSSMRLIIGTEDKSILEEDKHVIANMGGLYLLQYKTVEETEEGYLAYYGKVDFITPDAAILAVQDEEDAKEAADAAIEEEEVATDNVYTKKDNPFRAAKKALKQAEELDQTNAAEAEEASMEDAAKADKDSDSKADKNEDKNKKEEEKSAKAEEVIRRIALIDTGAALSDNVIEAISVIGSETHDENGHGDRMVEYITEENPNAQIISIKAIERHGMGDVSSVIAAINYAMDRGVDIINLSVSAYALTENAALADVIKKAVAAGITVVGAAGNHGSNAKYYIPANIEEALIVGSCYKNGERRDISNYGETVDYNIVSETTSEAAARLTGFISKDGLEGIPETLDKWLIFSTDYVAPVEEETEEETESEAETTEEETETETQEETGEEFEGVRVADDQPVDRDKIDSWEKLAEAVSEAPTNGTEVTLKLTKNLVAATISSNSNGTTTTFDTINIAGGRNIKIVADSEVIIYRNAEGNDTNFSMFKVDNNSTLTIGNNVTLTGKQATLTSTTTATTTVDGTKLQIKSGNEILYVQSGTNQLAFSTKPSTESTYISKSDQWELEKIGNTNTYHIKNVGTETYILGERQIFTGKFAFPNGVSTRINERRLGLHATTKATFTIENGNLYYLNGSDKESLGKSGTGAVLAISPPEGLTTLEYASISFTVITTNATEAQTQSLYWNKGDTGAGNNAGKRRTFDGSNGYGFFVTVNEGGTLNIQRGATFRDFNTVLWRDNAPLGVAPIYSEGTINMSGGTIRDNQVSYTIRNANNSSHADITDYPDYREMLNTITSQSGVGWPENAYQVADRATNKRDVMSAGAIRAESGTINITGGEILDNMSHAGAIALGANTYKTSGGEEVATTTLNMSGGVIDGNLASNNGIVFVTGGTRFNMTGGSIGLGKGETRADGSAGTGNRTFWGGGILAASNATRSGNKLIDMHEAVVVLNGGTIAGNENRAQGGGIMVHSNSVNLVKGEIKENISHNMGGGVYVYGLDNPYGDTPHVSFTLLVDKAGIYENLATYSGNNAGSLGSSDLDKYFFADYQTTSGGITYSPSDNRTGSDINRFMSGSGGGLWLCPQGAIEVNTQTVHIVHNDADVHGDDLFKDNGFGGGIVLGIDNSPQHHKNWYHDWALRRNVGTVSGSVGTGEVRQFPVNYHDYWMLNMAASGSARSLLPSEIRANSNDNQQSKTSYNPRDVFQKDEGKLTDMEMSYGYNGALALTNHYDRAGKCEDYATQNVIIHDNVARRGGGIGADGQLMFIDRDRDNEREVNEAYIDFEKTFDTETVSQGKMKYVVYFEEKNFKIENNKIFEKQSSDSSLNWKERTDLVIDGDRIHSNGTAVSGATPEIKGLVIANGKVYKEYSVFRLYDRAWGITNNATFGEGMEEQSNVLIIPSGNGSDNGDYKKARIAIPASELCIRKVSDDTEVPLFTTVKGVTKLDQSLFNGADLKPEYYWDTKLLIKEFKITENNGTETEEEVKHNIFHIGDISFNKKETETRETVYYAEDPTQTDAANNIVVIKYTFKFTMNELYFNLNATNKDTQVEKYINGRVHADFADFDQTFTYSVMAYVPDDATEVVIQDTLEDPLMFVDSSGRPQINANGNNNSFDVWNGLTTELVKLDSNNHLGDGSANASVKQAGTAITDVLKTRRNPSGSDSNDNAYAQVGNLNANGTLTANKFGNTIRVEINEAAIKKNALGGKWVRLSFNAAIRPSYKDIDKLKAIGWVSDTVDKRGTAALPEYAEDLNTYLNYLNSSNTPSGTTAATSDRIVCIKFDSERNAWAALTEKGTYYTKAKDGDGCWYKVEKGSVATRYTKINLSANPIESVLPEQNGVDLDSSGKNLIFYYRLKNAIFGGNDGTEVYLYRTTGTNNGTNETNWPVLDGTATHTNANNVEEQHAGEKNQAQYTVTSRNNGSYTYKTNITTFDVKQPEKYVNNQVHDVIGTEGYFNVPFEYSIMAYVPQDADELIIYDTLKEDLMFVDADGNTQFKMYTATQSTQTDTLNTSFGFKVNGSTVTGQSIVLNNPGKSGGYQLIYVNDNNHKGDGTGTVAVHRNNTTAANQHIQVNYSNNAGAVNPSGDFSNVVIGNSSTLVTDTDGRKTITPDPSGDTIWVRLRKETLDGYNLRGKWVILSYRAQIKPSKYDDIQKSVVKRRYKLLTEGLGSGVTVTKYLENNNFVIARTSNNKNYIYIKDADRVITGSGTKPSSASEVLYKWYELSVEDGASKFTPLADPSGPAYKDMTIEYGYNWVNGWLTSGIAPGANIHYSDRGYHDADNGTSYTPSSSWGDVTTDGTVVDGKTVEPDGSHFGLVNTANVQVGRDGGKYTSSNTNTVTVIPHLRDITFTKKWVVDQSYQKYLDVADDANWATVFQNHFKLFWEYGSGANKQTGEVTSLYANNFHVTKNNTYANGRYTWSFTWENLPYLDGQKYYVVESKFDGFNNPQYANNDGTGAIDHAHSGGDVVNIQKEKPGQTHISVKKNWDVGTALDARTEREDKFVTVQLLVGGANGTVYEQGGTQTLSNVNGAASWEYTWRDVPLYKMQSDKVIYNEDASAGTYLKRDGADEYKKSPLPAGISRKDNNWYKSSQTANILSDNATVTTDAAGNYWKGSDNKYYKVDDSWKTYPVVVGKIYSPQLESYWVKVVEEYTFVQSNSFTAEYYKGTDNIYYKDSDTLPAGVELDYSTRYVKKSITNDYHQVTEPIILRETNQSTGESYTAYAFDIVNTKPQIEKYINNNVHQDVLLDDEFEYEIMAYIPEEATDIEITDTFLDNIKVKGVRTLADNVTTTATYKDDLVIPTSSETTLSLPVYDTNNHEVNGTVASKNIINKATGSVTINGNTITLKVNKIAPWGDNLVIASYTDNNGTVTYPETNGALGRAYVPDSQGTYYIVEGYDNGRLLQRKIESDGSIAYYFGTQKFTVVANSAGTDSDNRAYVKVQINGAGTEYTLYDHEPYSLALVYNSNNQIEQYSLSGSGAMLYKKGSDGHYYLLGHPFKDGVTWDANDKNIYRTKTGLPAGTQFIGGRYVKLTVVASFTDDADKRAALINKIKGNQDTPDANTNWDVINTSDNKGNIGFGAAPLGNKGIGDGVIRKVANTPHAGVVNTSSYKVKYNGENTYSDNYISNTVTVKPLIDNITLEKVDVQGRPVPHTGTDAPSAAKFYLFERGAETVVPAALPADTSKIRYESVPVSGGDNNRYSFVDYDATNKTEAQTKLTYVKAGKYWLFEQTAPSNYIKGEKATAVEVSYKDGVMVITWPNGSPYEAGNAGAVIDVETGSAITAGAHNNPIAMGGSYRPASVRDPETGLTTWKITDTHLDGTTTSQRYAYVYDEYGIKEIRDEYYKPHTPVLIDSGTADKIRAILYYSPDGPGFNEAKNETSATWLMESELYLATHLAVLYAGATSFNPRNELADSKYSYMHDGRKEKIAEFAQWVWEKRNDTVSGVILDCFQQEQGSSDGGIGIPVSGLPLQIYAIRNAGQDVDFKVQNLELRNFEFLKIDENGQPMNHTQDSSTLAKFVLLQNSDGTTETLKNGAVEKYKSIPSGGISSNAYTFVPNTNEADMTEEYAASHGILPGTYWLKETTSPANFIAGDPVKVVVNYDTNGVIYVTFPDGSPAAKGNAGAVISHKTGEVVEAGGKVGSLESNGLPTAYNTSNDIINNATEADNAEGVTKTIFPLMSKYLQQKSSYNVDTFNINADQLYNKMRSAFDRASKNDFPQILAQLKAVLYYGLEGEGLEDIRGELDSNINDNEIAIATLLAVNAVTYPHYMGNNVFKPATYETKANGISQFDSDIDNYMTNAEISPDRKTAITDAYNEIMSKKDEKVIAALDLYAPIVQGLPSTGNAATGNAVSIRTPKWFSIQNKKVGVPLAIRKVNGDDNDKKISYAAENLEVWRNSNGGTHIKYNDKYYWIGKENEHYKIVDGQIIIIKTPDNYDQLEQRMADGKDRSNTAAADHHDGTTNAGSKLEGVVYVRQNESKLAKFYLIPEMPEFEVYGNSNNGRWIRISRSQVERGLIPSFLNKPHGYDAEGYAYYWIGDEYSEQLTTITHTATGKTKKLYKPLRKTADEPIANGININQHYVSTYTTPYTPAGITFMGYYWGTDPTATMAAPAGTQETTLAYYNANSSNTEQMRADGVYESIASSANAADAVYDFRKVGAAANSTDQSDFNVREGVYWLIETKSPEGFFASMRPFRIKVEIDPSDKNKAKLSFAGVKKDVTGTDTPEFKAYKHYVNEENINTRENGNYDLNFRNYEFYELPSAGGPGTYLFTIFGTMFLAIAAWLLWSRRRRINAEK